ncbi:SDR family NAD(P)-dependent oxidoreductase [Chitinophaga ginsengisoli]|uniref:Short-subunit dehydrogenase n=1 Tax=Chitinophaga ginsengisoli TaxID=363837 RepID=A0A2P8GM12_9BACT|nr:SDR family NAD(P)-dependent oxidoreductase [Chitinophaga ginsengisoli]PSL35008.1 short-subunit dehydrogenase [Chitinophaga ginsengisoli]
MLLTYISMICYLTERLITSYSDADIVNLTCCQQNKALEHARLPMSHVTLTDYEDNNQQSFWEQCLFPVAKPVKIRLSRKLSGKTILLTGASFGIGALVATLLAEYQVKLILVARTREKLEELQQSLQGKRATVFIVPSDLREERAIDSLLQELKRRNVEVDLFINNAGKSIHRGLDQSLDRYQDTQRCSATNYTGPVQLLLGLLPVLIKNRGHIINVSALNVLLPSTSGWSAYQSSKAAFDQWLRCMEPELKIRNVTVSSVYLPLVRTRMSMVNEKNHGRMAMSKAKAANIILNCIVLGKRKYRPWWTGFVLLWCSLFPNLWYRMQVCYLKKNK